VWKAGVKLLDTKLCSAEPRHRNDWRKERGRRDREPLEEEKEKFYKILLYAYTMEFVLFASTSWP